MKRLVILHAPRYEPDEGCLQLRWTLVPDDAVNPVTSRCSLKAVFQPALERVTEEQALDIFLGCLLPHLALSCDELEVDAGAIGVTDGQREFWVRYLADLGVKTAVSFAGAVSEKEKQPSAETGASRPGIFFGGGVESLTLLSMIRHQRPHLLCVEGPCWMNSDYALNDVKRGLQQSLAERLGVSFLRVWTDARTLFREGDLHVNRYISGSLMYYLLAPVMQAHSIDAVYLASEAEYARVDDTYDRSLHARFIHRVARRPYPPVLSPLNAIPKIEILEYLYHRDPDLLEYLYSCLRNSERRWCGECGKCGRIAAFCDAIGIPRTLIEMPEWVRPVAETGTLGEMYWHARDEYLLRKGR